MPEFEQFRVPVSGRQQYPYSDNGDWILNSREI